MIEKGWKLDASFCFGKCILSVCQWKSYTVWAFLGAPNGSRPWAGHILHHCVYDQWQNTPACPVFNDSLTAQFNLKIWPRQSPQACNAYYVSIAYDLYARHFQPRAFPPGKPRALDARWFPWAGHLAVNSVPLKQQQKTRFVTSCRHFWRRSESRVSNSQALSFWSRWRAFIDNKTTFFVFFQLEWLISWPILCSSIELKQLCLLWMATNNFVYRSAGLRGRLIVIAGTGGGICQQKLPGGPDMWPVFSIARGMPGVFPGGRVFAAGVDSHITYQHSLQHTGLLSPSYRRQLLTGRLLNKIFGTVKTNEQKK